MPAINELLPKLGDSDLAVAHRAYRELENIATRASDPANDRRTEVAAELAAALHARGEPKKDKDGKEKPGDLLYSMPAQNLILRLLSYVGGAKEVPALAQAVQDLDLREMARLALEYNTSAEATDALIKALEEVGPEFRIGVVNALGRRKCPKALAALQKAATDEEMPVRIAAVEALAHYAEPANDALIAKATHADCANCRKRARVARVRLADTLDRAGKKAEAKKIFQAIAAGEPDCPQTRAAKLAIQAG